MGVEASGRVDVDHVGLVGHSFGGGMVPRMTQLVAERGWGTRSLWAAMLAPFYSYQVGGGPIALPVHARVLVSGYEHDVFVDHRIAIETFRALGVPDDHKRYTVVLGERRGRWNLGSDHLTPLSLPVPLPLFAEDALDRYGIFRPVDGLARCARWGEWCDLDLTDMGTWSDGAPFRAAISTDDPVDLGPPAIECDLLGGLLNPRPCP
ncbi:MAG: hypothetical protein M5U14_08670 [Acidimicrobiia bacterium]|nr:hypothetical protein [Acidimicrobiia bacterium]